LVGSKALGQNTTAASMAPRSWLTAVFIVVVISVSRWFLALGGRGPSPPTEGALMPVW